MRFLKVLVLALALVLAAAVPASARPAPAATFTLDTDNPNAAAVAKLWSSGTDILVQVGPCEGERCIEISVDSVPCDMSSGLEAPAGCAYNSGAMCFVEIQPLATTQSDLGFNILGHEVGHCLLGTGYHPMTERSIMYPYISRSDRKKGLTRDDKVFAQQRF